MMALNAVGRFEIANARKHSSSSGDSVNRGTRFILYGDTGQQLLGHTCPSLASDGEKQIPKKIINKQDRE